MTEASDLELQARAFAAELTDTVRGVLGQNCPAFVAELGPDLTRLVVHTEGGAEIPLTIGGEDALYVIVEYTCEWDQAKSFLAVRKAGVAVHCTDVNEPLFRYEFLKEMGPAWPSAHLHVHAHRDEVVYHLFRAAKKGKTLARHKAVLANVGKQPRLSSIHFPLGGARMRPALEDVLQTLLSEFGVDREADAQRVLDEGRARWRRHQVATLVRDAPAEAIRVLERLGYEVRWAGSGDEPGERTDRLTSI